METCVIAYVGENSHERGVRRMASQGWRVLQGTSSVPARGCLGSLVMVFTLGIFGLFFRKKTHFVVTFGRG